ncbi:MAG: hypothetical protein GX845_06095 [Erysipelothrix sp.]|jgi:Tfp pilus assembly protein PilN|nr:hypothetical protein [Erysipelothrix sp.]
MKKQDMNLLARYEELHKTKASQYSDNKIYFIVLGVLLLLFGAYSIKLAIDNALLKKDITELESYVNDPNIQTKLSYINQLEQDINQIEEMLQEVESINDVFEEAVRFNSVPITILNYSRPANVEFRSMDYQDGKVNVAITGRTAEDISNYVLRLQRTEHFKKVSYSGYSYNDSENRYYANIECVLQGGL